MEFINIATLIKKMLGMCCPANHGWCPSIRMDPWAMLGPMLQLFWNGTNELIVPVPQQEQLIHLQICHWSLFHEIEFNYYFFLLEAIRTGAGGWVG